MKDSTKVLMYLSVIGVFIELLEGKRVDTSDFEDAVEILGFDFKYLMTLNSLQALQEICKGYSELNISNNLLKELIEGE